MDARHYYSPGTVLGHMSGRSVAVYCCLAAFLSDTALILLLSEDVLYLLFTDPMKENAVALHHHRP